MEDIMKTAFTFKQQLKRLIASCGLATVMFAGGFSLESAKADDVAVLSDGVVITPASALPL